MTATTTPLHALPTPATAAASAAIAKARLLAWADETDAAASAKPVMGTIIIRSTFAFVGGFLLARLFTTRRNTPEHLRAKRMGKRLISWALVARAGSLLLPHILSAARRAVQSGIFPSSPTATPGASIPQSETHNAPARQ